MNLSQFNRGFVKRVLLKDGKVKMILTRANPQSACQLEKALSAAALYTCKESIIKTYQQKIVCLMTDKGMKIKTEMLMSSHETVWFLMRKTDWTMNVLSPQRRISRKKQGLSKKFCSLFWTQFLNVRHLPEWKVAQTRTKQSHNNTRIRRQKKVDILPTPEVVKLSPPDRIQVWKQIQWIFIQVESREVFKPDAGV